MVSSPVCSATWELTVGSAFDEGTEAIVLGVDLADGTPAVLKLLVPRSGDSADLEAEVLRRVDGDGCVRLLRHDRARGALLLERLGPSMHQLEIPFEQRLRALADLARRVWRPVPAGVLPTGAAKAAWLAEHIERLWEELDHPCSEAAVADALACAERRRAAHDDERAVLVHGDIHQWNALRAGDGWALVDPDGLHAEPEYDLGILMREDPLELLAGDPWDRARLARRAVRLRRRWRSGSGAWWSGCRRGCCAPRSSSQPEGRDMLHAADVVAGLSGGG